MKKIKGILLTLLLGISILGCTTTEYLSKGDVSFPNSVDKQKTMDAIVYVLSENSVGITMVNESFGLIQSDWKQISDMSDNIGRTLALAFASGGGNTYFSEYVKLDFRITDKGYSVTPLYRQNSERQTAFATSNTASDRAPTKEGKDGQFVLKIVDEINALLNIEGEVIWTTKEE